MTARSHGLSAHAAASAALDAHGIPRENGTGRLSLTARIEMLALQVPELMGVKEAAACLGVKPSNLYGVKGLPEPAARLERGALWVASEIRALASVRRRAANVRSQAKRG